MSAQNNGGPAFPSLTQLNSPSHDYRAVSAGGISARDYFAAKAIEGSAEKLGDWLLHDQEDAARSLARRAYLIADAMLAERAK